MKKLFSLLLAFAAFAVIGMVAMFVTNFGNEFNPILSLCVEYTKGFTGHTDVGGMGHGIAVAASMLGLARIAPKEEAAKDKGAMPEDVIASLKSLVEKPDGFTDEQKAQIAEIAKAETKTVKAGFGTNVVKAVGDPESVTKAFKGYLLGNVSGEQYKGIMKEETKASNDTDMNVGTSADGGYAVPTGHYNGIIAKKNESALAQKLGVLQIPGTGTTVNVPVETGSANVLVSTAETVAYDRDAPVLAQKAMTLVKYTKKIPISEELIQDEDSRLFEFLNNYVGRAFALTENGLLVTEVLTNGSSLLTTASATVATATEIKSIPYLIADGYDESAFKWVMRRATEGTIRGMQGTVFLFDETPNGTANTRNISGYPVFHAAAAEAYGTTAKKFALFGDFSSVGQRSAPQFTVLRDPYSAADTGQIVLRYSMRTVFKVLDSSGVGYAKHA